MILNYSTKVPTTRSIQHITVILVKHGASAINQEYNGSGEVTALSFALTLNNQRLSFRLPIDWKATLQVMKEDGTPRSYLTPEHAQRVSWRIIKDWVEVQLALAETKMVTIPQVFLPYAVRADGKTLYQVVAENPALLLGEGN
jgi:hypothetical protein